MHGIALSCSYKKKVISGQYVAALAENTQHEELLKL